MQALLSALIRQQQPALDAALRWRLTPVAIKHFAAAAVTATDVQSTAGTSGSQWWRDPSMDAAQAQAVFRQRLQTHGAQDQRGLLAVFERISSQEEAAAALEAVAELRRHRAHQQQHSLFHMVKMDAFFRACRSVDAWKVAVEALERATELGIYAGVARYNMVLKWLCNQRALSEARQLFEMMKQHKVRPDSTSAYHLVRTSMLLGHRSLAEAYVREFESNGIRLAPSVKAWLSKPPSQLAAVRKKQMPKAQPSLMSQPAGDAGASTV